MSSSWVAQLSAKAARSAAIAFAVFVSFILLLGSLRGGFSDTGVLAHSWRSGTTVSAARQRSLNDIENTTLGFENIVAINLPERTDHRDGLILASSVSDFHVDFIDGVRGDSILPKALPQGHKHDKLPHWIGSWRARMNAISRVVEKNWTSALIMEDDLDWDIRLKSLLQDIALSSSYVSKKPDQGRSWLQDIDTSHVPLTSPYGDGWDVLWLGHCGMNMPSDDQATAILRRDDPSVPETRYQTSWDVNAPCALKDYPAHTRVFTTGAHLGTCSLAYAVSQAGARKLINDLGLHRLDSAFDLMLRDWCEGDNGNERHKCVSVLPQLFDHYRPAGSNIADSEINPEDDKTRDHDYTLNIRWSVRLNMNKILRRDTDYDDQYPDTTF